MAQKRPKLQDLLPPDRLTRSPSPSSAYVPSGTLWPTGEFSLGYAKHAGDDGQWLPHLADSPDGWLASGEEPEGLPPLNLSDAPNSHKEFGPALPRGLNGITGYGRNMVKSFGALVNRHYPHHRVTMGTITVPPMSSTARGSLVREWPQLLRQLLQWLSRHLEAAGLPELICSVSEVQPKRLAESGEGYLHLHVLWLNKPGKRGGWALAPNDIRSWVSAFLERRVEDYSSGHVNVNVKPVTGEVSRYMAKYMSKGSEELAEAMQDWGFGICPPTWWNMTKLARDWVKSHVHKGRLPGELLEQFLQYAWNTDPDAVFAFIRQIDMEWEGASLTVGWRGRLHPEVYESALAMLVTAS